MITMDLKGMSWVGDMYNRFESMCVEVDEIICQDTAKYVENQMRTVGATVKKFCSDVVEDLLPPSSLDPVKEENPSITEKTTVENDGDSVNSTTEQTMKDADSLVNEVNNINHHSCSAVFSVIKAYEPKLDNSVVEQCAGKDLDSQCAENNLSNLQSYWPKGLDNRQDPEQNSPDVARMGANVREGPDEELTHSEVFSKIDEPLSEHRGATSKFTSVSGVNKSNSAVISEDMIFASVEAVEESKTTVSSCEDTSANIDEISNRSIASESKNGDADNYGVLVSKQFDKVKLGESCVLVEKSEHSFALPPAYEQKSYKKKIRYVFSPRRWSKGKRDQKQLGVWYEEQTGNKLCPASLNHKLCPASLNHAGIPDSQHHESLELEWELL